MKRRPIIYWEDFDASLHNFMILVKTIIPDIFLYANKTYLQCFKEKYEYTNKRDIPVIKDDRNPRWKEQIEFSIDEIVRWTAVVLQVFTESKDFTDGFTMENIVRELKKHVRFGNVLWKYLDSNREEAGFPEMLAEKIRKEMNMYFWERK